MKGRILLDPAPAEGAGGGDGAATGTPPAQQAAGTQPAQKTAAAAPNADQVTISVQEFRSLLDGQRQLTEQLAAIRANEAKARENEARILAEKGQVEDALKTIKASTGTELQAANARADAMESLVVNGSIATEAGAALFGVNFINAECGAEALNKIASRLEAARDATGRPITDANGKLIIREKGTGRPAAEVAREFLAGPIGSAYVKAQTTGGTGARTGQGQAATEAVPLTFQQRAILQTREGPPGQTRPAYGLK